MTLTEEEVRKIRHDLNGLIYILQTLESGIEQGETTDRLKILTSGSIQKLNHILARFNQK